MSTSLPKAWMTHARRTLPRYTSYPTAVALRPGTLEEVETWLIADEGESLSVYVHIPFCDRLCWYCGCHTSIVSDYERVAAFQAQLLREIALWAERPGVRRGVVRHLHFGGGSPNILRPADFVAVVDRLRSIFRFAPDAEVAVELDPARLEIGFIASLAQAGVTRVSLGVQPFDPAVQVRVNRPQPYAQVAEAVEELRRAGIAGVNFDLMYGLPGQTPDNVAETADLAAGLAPDRLAVFGYAHVPWLKKHQSMIAETELADAAGRWAQAGAAHDRLVSAGYEAIGLDHYARPDDRLSRALAQGGLRRNFQGYTDDPARVLVPLGPSAIGQWPTGLVQNAADARVWRQAISDGRLPVARILPLTSEDRLRGAVIEALMTGLSADVDQISQNHGQSSDHLDACLDRLREAADAGLCRIDGRRVWIPDAARRLVRTVAAAFDAAGEPPQRHAPAV